MFDLTKINFSSTVNYMKQSTEFSGDTTLTLPSAGNAVTHTVTHNLGYIPYFDVFVDFDNDGIIWAGEKVDEYTETSRAVSSTVPTLSYWSTTTTLTMRLLNDTSPTATGTRKIYWLIYLDYGSTS